MDYTIKSYPLNNTLYQAEDAQLYNAVRTSGVYSGSEDFAVRAVGNQPMQIMVSEGLGWISYDRFAGIVVANREKAVFNLKTAEAALNRIDRVVIRLDRTANQTGLAVKTGTPATLPKAPELQRDSGCFELGIADIMVRAGQTVIADAGITDTRLNEELCGIMRDGVTGIPTQALFDSWISWLDGVQAETDEKIQLMNEWIEIFRSTIGEEFRSWFDSFKQEKESEYRVWMDVIGEQLAAEVGSALFGFAVEGGNLMLYYNNERDAYRFQIEDGYLVYELDDEIAGSESLSLARLKEQLIELAGRVTEIEGKDILNLVAEIRG